MINHRTHCVWKVACTAAVVGVGVFVAPKIASACTPHGLIGNDWSNLGGASGPLGPCANDEMDNNWGGRIEFFTFGFINWTGFNEPFNSEAYAVWGNIANAWGNRYGFLNTGQPITNQESVQGAFNAQQNIFYNVSTGAVTYIVYSPGGGDGTPCDNSDRVCVIYGTIGAAWSANLGSGQLITPIDDEYSVSGGREQDFNRGTITWNASNDVACGYNTNGNLLWRYNASPNEACLFF